MQLAKVVLGLSVVVACSSPSPPVVAPAPANRCDQVVTAAVDRAYRASGAAGSQDLLEAIKAVKVRRCVADQWPPGALDCAAHAANIPELQGCRDKLLAQQAQALSAQESRVRDDWEQLLADAQALQVKMCACQDTDCAIDVGAQVRARGLGHRRSHFHDDAPRPEPPQDVAERVEASTKKLTACETKLGGSSIAAAIVKMREFTGEMCACKDAACAQRVSDEMTRWAQARGRDRDADMRPTDDETKEITDITKQMTDCMMKAMSAGSSGNP